MCSLLIFVLSLMISTELSSQQDMSSQFIIILSVASRGRSRPQGIWNIVELEDRDGCYPVGKEAYTSFLNDDHTYVIGEGWND